MLPVSLAPRTMGEAMEFSKLVSQSSMVPAAYKGKPADILVAVQWGAELGLAPLQALQNIATINGKPAVYGDAALALVRGSTVCEDVEEFIEGEGEQMIATCIAKRKGSKPVVAKFSVSDAKSAGLWRKQGPWTQYPRRMLQMRARGFALRDAFPDVLKGLITAEEAQDYPRQEKDVTPAMNPLDQFAKQAVQQIENAPPAPVEVPQEAIEGEVIVDDVPTPSSAPRHPIIVPGGEVVAEFDNIPDWENAYVTWMQKVCDSKKYNARTKMTKLREFRECNEATIGKLQPSTRATLMGKYQHHLKALGAQSHEEGSDET